MTCLEYRKGTRIRQAPVFRHLRVLLESPWKFIIWMNEFYYTACCWFSYISNISILPSQFWQISFESYWVCLHGLESRSERRFGTWFKTWLGSWFELRAFTWATNALSNHDQELRTASDILLLLRSPRALIDPCAYVWLQRAFFKMHTHESRSETALRLHGLESGFLGGSRCKTPIFFAFQNAFQKPDLKQAFCLHGLKSGFQIRKRPNHVLKRLSERDSSPCKHTHWLHCSKCRILVLLFFDTEINLHEECLEYVRMMMTQKLTYLECQEWDRMILTQKFSHKECPECMRMIVMQKFTYKEFQVSKLTIFLCKQLNLFLSISYNMNFSCNVSGIHCKQQLCTTNVGLAYHLQKQYLNGPDFGYKMTIIDIPTKFISGVDSLLWEWISMGLNPGSVLPYYLLDENLVHTLLLVLHLYPYNTKEFSFDMYYFW